MSRRRELGTRAPQPPSLTAAIAELGTRNRALEGVPNLRTQQVEFDGLGSVIPTGDDWNPIRIHFDCEILAWGLLADQPGDFVLDIWKTDFASYPPTIADTITAAAQPTLASAESAEDSTLAGWTTTIAAGDVFRFHVDSASAVKKVTLTLFLQSF